MATLNEFWFSFNNIERMSNMSELIKYTLIENGLDFLLSSIEDFPLDKNKPDIAKKKLKYSLLHLSASLELFFKKRLEKENWVYIFDDMNKADKTKFGNRDFKSVDLETAIQRLDKISGVQISTSDKTMLNHFRRKRNKLEHYDFEDTITALENDIIKVVRIVVTFISNNLLDTIVTKGEGIIFEEIKDRLRELGQYTDELTDLARKQLDNDDVSEEEIVTCPHCFEEFLSLAPNKKGNHYCYYCNWSPKNENGFKEVAEAYIDKNIGSIYEMKKDGDNIPLYQCFECGSETLVINEEIAHCFQCGEDFENIDWCLNCGRPMHSAGEDGILICGECFEYKMSKD